MTATEPLPFYFGPPGAELYGWLHLPSEERRRGMGLIVCNPFGFEEVCSHRSLKHFAQAACAAGVPSLRFDFAGCGDSQGDEFDTGTPQRWIASVNAAIDTLKRVGGVTQVVVLGLRLGAMLGALATTDRDDVPGLIAIAPVVRGRGYIRELTMLGQTGSAPVSGGSDALESAGFLMTRDTAAFVSQVDLRAAGRPPAPRVLIVQRDDVSGESDWAPALQALGADVRVEHWPGYALMMEDAQRAVVPHEMASGVVACLESWADKLALPRQATEAPGAAQLRCRVPVPGDRVVEVIERPVYIDTGAATKLFGLLAAPELPGARPAVLMLNSGSIHHIGPNRLWVRLARQWAARGFTVLRLDIAGIGDSAARLGAPENVVYSRHAMDDVAAALRYLATHAGASECHLVGLCSGAYHALKAAVAGQAVASALMINPLTYFWEEGTELSDVKEYALEEMTSKFRGKLFTAEPWRKLLRGKLDVRLVIEVARRRAWGLIAPHLVELARVLHLPIRHNLAHELELAVRHGIRLRFVFAERAPGFALLRKQSGRALRRLLDRRQAAVEFIPNADHTFTRLEARERLVALLDRLMLPLGGGQIKP